MKNAEEEAEKLKADLRHALSNGRFGTKEEGLGYYKHTFKSPIPFDNIELARILAEVLKEDFGINEDNPYAGTYAYSDGAGVSPGENAVMFKIAPEVAEGLQTLGHWDPKFIGYWAPKVKGFDQIPDTEPVLAKQREQEQQLIADLRDALSSGHFAGSKHALGCYKHVFKGPVSFTEKELVHILRQVLKDDFGVTNDIGVVNDRPYQRLDSAEVSFDGCMPRENAVLFSIDPELAQNIGRNGRWAPRDEDVSKIEEHKTQERKLKADLRKAISRGLFKELEGGKSELGAKKDGQLFYKYSFEKTVSFTGKELTQILREVLKDDFGITNNYPNYLSECLDTASAFSMDSDCPIKYPGVGLISEENAVMFSLSAGVINKIEGKGRLGSVSGKHNML